jgi:diaminopimelate decarboxylase
MNLNRPFLEQIAAEHGPTFYLLDAPRFRENFNNLTAAFRHFYPKTSIAYSYKTNYIPRFCQLVDELGGFAEVVSSMEMTLAQRIGVPNSRIFFNGPYKEANYVRELLVGGGIVNVDSMEELNLIREIARDHAGPAFRLGLRCNFDVNDDVLSRFGFDVTSPAFEEVVGIIDQDPALTLVGLHCHFATRSRACWENRTKGMIEVISRHFRERLDQLEFISLGGGMYGEMNDEMKAQFPVAIPSFEDYAAVAAKPFAEYFERQASAHRPMLIVEPGTALVANAMKFVCTVVSIKHVRGRPIASLSGSTYNINPTPNRKNVPIELFAADAAHARMRVENAYFGGYTCIESDYLYKNYTGELAVGDFVAFDDVGSYSVVMKPPFILPNVAVLEPDEAGQSYKLIKRREVFDDIFHTYTFS